jgi:hypothetical protein
MPEPIDPRRVRLAGCAGLFLSMPPALQAALLRRGVLGSDPATGPLAEALDHNRPGAAGSFIRWLDGRHPATGPVPQAWCGEVERAWATLVPRRPVAPAGCSGTAGYRPAGDLASLLSALPTIPGLPSASSVVTEARQDVSGEVSTQANAALDRFYIGVGVAALVVLAGMGTFAWYATRQMQEMQDRPMVMLQPRAVPRTIPRRRR